MAAMYGADAPTPKRESQVFGQVGRLQHVVDDAYNAAMNLGNRLSNVCRPCPPTAVDKSPNVAEALVPLAENVREQADKVQMIGNILRDVLDRLEV